MENFMICPKCEEGSIQKILFKKSNRVAMLCEYCGAVWFEEESINANTSHSIQSLTKDDGMEYTFIDLDEQGKDFKPVLYPKYK